MTARQFVRGGLLTLVALGSLATGAVVLAAGGRSPHRNAISLVSTSVRTLSITCRSPGLGGRLPARVYLPPRYDSGSRRYPVVYFLHGLPANPQSYTQSTFLAQALVSAHQQAIVVAPQGARATNEDREYLDWSPTEDWPRVISDDLTACIDRRFHTIATRQGRALIGLSAGGYGAFNVGLRNLGVFASVESWSGYFVATDPAGDHVLKLGSIGAQQAAAVPDGTALAKELVRWPSLIAFYVGRADVRFADMNQAFDASLGRYGIAHVFRVYPGGHSAALWRAQAPAWLTMALTYLSDRHTVLDG